MNSYQRSKKNVYKYNLDKNELLNFIKNCQQISNQRNRYFKSIHMHFSQNETILIQVSTNQKLNTLHDVEIIDIPTCRICLMQMNSEDIFSPCQCKGSNSYFHQECLVQWLKKSKQHKDSFMTYFSTCEICKGRIFLLTNTKFRCITKEQLKQELFQRHVCCTMTTIIFLVLSFIVLGIILYVSSLASSSAQMILYGVGISVTVAIILITLIVYLCTYALKSDIEIKGIDRKRKRVPSLAYAASNNKCKITPQNLQQRQIDIVNHNNTIDHLVV